MLRSIIRKHVTNENRDKLNKARLIALAVAGVWPFLVVVNILGAAVSGNFLIPQFVFAPGFALSFGGFLAVNAINAVRREMDEIAIREAAYEQLGRRPGE